MAIPLAAIAAVPSVIQAVQGLFQGAKGRRLAEQNKRPTYEIPREFQQNLAIAENMGRTGLPQEQYNQAQQNFQRNQASALRQFGRMSNPRGLAGIVRAGNDATMGLDVADAQARLQNQRNAMSFRTQLGQQQLAKQQWDKMAKYGENADAASALMGAGRQNVMGALSNLSRVGQMAMYNGSGIGGGSNMATATSAPQFNPSQFMSNADMPNPMTEQPMSGFPFQGFGGMSNYNRISQMGRIQPNYWRGVHHRF